MPSLPSGQDVREKALIDKTTANNDRPCLRNQSQSRDDKLTSAPSSSQLLIIHCKSWRTISPKMDLRPARESPCRSGSSHLATARIRIRMRRPFFFFFTPPSTALPGCSPLSRYVGSVSRSLSSGVRRSGRADHWIGRWGRIWSFLLITLVERSDSSSFEV